MKYSAPCLKVVLYYTSIKSSYSLRAWLFSYIFSGAANWWFATICVFGVNVYIGWRYEF